jgi:hypothetical protein
MSDTIAVNQRLRAAAEAFRTVWPSVHANLLAVCDAFPDVPEALLMPLPQMVREVVEDAIREARAA